MSMMTFFSTIKVTVLVLVTSYFFRLTIKRITCSRIHVTNSNTKHPNTYPMFFIYIVIRRQNCGKKT